LDLQLAHRARHLPWTRRTCHQSGPQRDLSRAAHRTIGSAGWGCTLMSAAIAKAAILKFGGIQDEPSKKISGFAISGRRARSASDHYGRPCISRRPRGARGQFLTENYRESHEYAKSNRRSSPNTGITATAIQIRTNNSADRSRKFRPARNTSRSKHFGRDAGVAASCEFGNTARAGRR
jgi:hypothetical protein